MPIYAYDGISRDEITKQRIAPNGKTYDLDHPSELVVDMRFQGEKSTSNSQGWERNNSYYFKELTSKHPEIISKKNQYRISNGQAPVVDKKMVESIPKYAEFKGERLIHHHVGSDGQAVAVPQGIHRGFGGIHNVEKQIGVTKSAKEFSLQCKNLAEKDKSFENCKAEKFKQQLSLHKNQTEKQLEKDKLTSKKDLSTKENESLDDSELDSIKKIEKKNQNGYRR